MSVQHDSPLDTLVPLLGTRMPQLVARVRDALRVQWPPYADFLAAHEDEVARAGEEVVRRLVSLAPEPGADLVERELFEFIGRVQCREGVDLTELLSAYRLGARVFWQEVSAAAVDAAVEPATLAALAEGVFFFVDQLSSASARGYVLEQGVTAAEREHHREALVSLLLSDRAGDAEVRAAAHRAGWTVPEEVAVVLVPPDDHPGRDVLSRLDASSLPIRRSSLSGAIVPYPASPATRASLRRVLHGSHATVGAAVSPSKLPRSLQVAEIAARLQQDHVLDGDPVFAAEHLDAIIVHRDDALLDVLRREVLAPLENSPPASRDRLRETLRSWLLRMGDRQAMAEDLHVHPQTVRYRMGRLHEIFGPSLDEPGTRARLTLALAWTAS